MPFVNDPKQNPFCALMANSNHSCAACLQLQSQLQEQAELKPATLKCFAGLCDSAVPVRVGDNVVAFLQTDRCCSISPTTGSSRARRGSS